MKRATLMTKCEDCGEETKCYKLAGKWLCEVCFDLRKESL